jgi:hypothetical protein
MTQSLFSLDHQLAELRQVGNDLRAARQLRQTTRNSPTVRESLARSFRSLFAGVQTDARPSRQAAH